MMAGGRPGAVSVRASQSFSGLKYTSWLFWQRTCPGQWQFRGFSSLAMMALQQINQSMVRIKRLDSCTCPMLQVWPRVF